MHFRTDEAYAVSIENAYWIPGMNGVLILKHTIENVSFSIQKDASFFKAKEIKPLGGGVPLYAGYVKVQIDAGFGKIALSRCTLI